MEHTDAELIAKRGHGSIPIETYRGREIYRTADRTLVTSPAGHEYCVEHLGDEGQLHTEATVEACREFIDGDEPNPEAALERLGETALRVKAERDMLLVALKASVGRMMNVQIDLNTGVSKAKAGAALASAIKTAEDALAKAGA
jgi:hypothetical protein